MDLFPVLERGTLPCTTDGNLALTKSDIQVPGVIDLTGATLDPKVDQLARAHFVPILPLSMSSALPPDTIAKVLAQAMDHLKWNQVAIVHATDEHSIHIVKLLGQASSASSQTCFAAVEPLPAADGKDPIVVQNAHARVLRAVVSRLEKDTAVLVIGSGSVVEEFVIVMNKHPNLSARHQWLFSSLPPPNVLDLLDLKFKEQRIFSLAPQVGFFPTLSSLSLSHYSINI